MNFDQAMSSGQSQLDQRWESALRTWLPIIALEKEDVKTLRELLGKQKLSEAIALIDKIAGPPPAGQKGLGDRVLCAFAGLALDELIIRGGRVC